MYIDAAAAYSAAAFFAAPRTAGVVMPQFSTLDAHERLAQYWAHLASVHMARLATAHGLDLKAPLSAFSTLVSIMKDLSPTHAFMHHTEPATDSGEIGLDDIVLRGARYLMNAKCDLKFELVLTGEAQGHASRPPHIFLRILSGGNGKSFIADPTIRLHDRLGECASSVFETVFGYDATHTLIGYPEVRAFSIAGFSNGIGVFVASGLAPELKLIIDRGRRLAPIESAGPEPKACMALSAGLHAGSPSGSRSATSRKARRVERNAGFSLITVKTALTEIAHIAQTAFVTPHKVHDVLNRYTLRNGRLGNRIAMLMAVNPNAGSIPFANYMQLICGLCTERIIPPKDAVTYLTFESRTAARPRLWPSSAISSHWCNAAAPVFAQALQTIVATDPVSSDWIRMNIIQLLSRRSIDENAIGCLQQNLSFYEKLRLTDMNQTAIRATDILCESGLMPKRGAVNYRRKRMATEISLAHHPFPLKTVRQLSVVNQREMALAIELDAAAPVWQLINKMPPAVA